MINPGIGVESCILNTFVTLSNMGSRLFIPPKALLRPSHIEERNPNNPTSPFESLLDSKLSVIKLKFR